MENYIATLIFSSSVMVIEFIVIIILWMRLSAEKDKNMDNRLGEIKNIIKKGRSHEGIEALTDRELEIMAKLIEGKKPAKIAEELFISENTVKTHKKSIYSKTNTRNIVELVKKAGVYAE